MSGPQDLQAVGERLEWLRRRLIELEMTKTRFLRHVSHELKTPLTAIRESGQLLGDEVTGPLNAEQREIITILDDSGRRLQTLIEDLLQFARTQFQLPRLALSDISSGARRGGPGTPPGRDSCALAGARHATRPRPDARRGREATHGHRQPDFQCREILPHRRIAFGCPSAKMNRSNPRGGRPRARDPGGGTPADLRGLLSRR
ncbi:MAG: histidine kinase dimerization/phospho-acceptor domain-containing protein [Arhodomonas sp.]|nr:histidine kinase dimerization/phospho-acceptor domain-containing protein [Arhodomonas sp.]